MDEKRIAPFRVSSSLSLVRHRTRIRVVAAPYFVQAASAEDCIPSRHGFVAASTGDIVASFLISRRKKNNLYEFWIAQTLRNKVILEIKFSKNSVVLSNDVIISIQPTLVS